MLILIAPKFHPRHSRPRIAYTDSATIPVCRYYRYRRYYYIIFAAIVTVTTTLAATIHIIFTADRYCCLPLRYHRSLSLRLLFAVAALPFIIFSLPPAALRLALIPPPVPLSPTAVAAATAAHCHCCRCRENNTCYRHSLYISKTIVSEDKKPNQKPT